VCYENSYEKLLADLAVHSLDIVISDSPVPAGISVRAFTHVLGETGVSFFGAKSLAHRYKRGFPKSLDGAPMLLPLENLAARRSLNQWFDRNAIAPHVVGEFEDSALLTVFGADGLGVFAAPTAVEPEIIAQHGVELVGRADDVRERFYAISVERRLKNPAVLAISERARYEVFAAGARASR
jgi:LysR family transcriptional activator of nhaA